MDPSRLRRLMVIFNFFARSANCFLWILVRVRYKAGSHGLGMHYSQKKCCRWRSFKQNIYRSLGSQRGAPAAAWFWTGWSPGTHPTWRRQGMGITRSSTMLIWLSIEIHWSNFQLQGSKIEYLTRTAPSKRIPTAGWWVCQFEPNPGRISSWMIPAAPEIPSLPCKWLKPQEEMPSQQASVVQIIDSIQKEVPQLCKKQTEQEIKNTRTSARWQWPHFDVLPWFIPIWFISRASMCFCIYPHVTPTWWS